MHKILKKIIFKMFLPHIFSNICGECIDKSGDEGIKNNCFYFYVDRDDKPYFVGTSLENFEIGGLKRNGVKYSEKITINLNDLIDANIRISHYYGLDYIEFNSIFNYAWHRFSKYIYIKIYIRKLIKRRYQYFFNKRKFVTKKRIQLLQFMMDDQINRDHNGIDEIDLMTKLYSVNWISHPSAEKENKKLRFYLDSLIETCEVKEVNHEFIVTGKAINTLEKYEKEEKRHKEMVTLQRLMFYITSILVVTTAYQAGLIELIFQLVVRSVKRFLNLS